jgi:hypothetical protein
MRVNRLFATVVGTVLLGVVSTAQTPLTPITFSDTRLANGLRVIISEDHCAPTYSNAVSYGVGSRDERQGAPEFGGGGLRLRRLRDCGDCGD